MMNTTLLDFITYLEGLAAAHVEIAHNAATHPAFIKFYDADDIQGTVRHKVKHLPCVMVKDYDFSYRDNKSDNLHKVREIEFIVIDKLGRNVAAEDVYAVWNRTEEIGEEMVIRMVDDKRNRRNQAVINFDLNAVRGVPVDVGAGSLFGTSFSIPVSSVRSNDPDKTKWSDL